MKKLKNVEVYTGAGSMRLQKRQRELERQRVIAYGDGAYGETQIDTDGDFCGLQDYCDYCADYHDPLACARAYGRMKRQTHIGPHRPRVRGAKQMRMEDIGIQTGAEKI